MTEELEGAWKKLRDVREKIDILEEALKNRPQLAVEYNKAYWAWRKLQREAMRDE